MAVITENNYVSDGVTVLYAVTFEYISEPDVKVSFDGTETTDFSFDNATTIRLDSAPALGVDIRIFRRTDVEELPATFFPGSTIQARDLNDNFNVSLYVAQEAARDSATAGESFPTAARAEAKADAAVATADTALANSQTANTTAGNALTVANAASTTATNAEATANAAQTSADAAIALVASVQLPTVVPNVAAIPGSPANDDLVEVTDSTGIESFSPLTGLPAGFVGDAGVAVKILYQVATWTFVEYRPTDPDDRYTTESYVDSTIAPVATTAANANATAGAAQTTANAALPKAGGTMTGQITFAAGQTFPMPNASTTQAGIVQLIDSNNSTSTTLAPTAAALKATNDGVSTAVNTATNAEVTANAAAATANGLQGEIDTANSNATAALDAANIALARPGLYVPEADVDVPNTTNTLSIANITGGSTEPWMKVEICFRNVNVSGTDSLIVQVAGADGVFQTSGYQSASQSHGNGSGMAETDTGFIIRRGDSDADVNGRMTICWLPDDATNGELIQDHVSGWRSSTEQGVAYGGGFIGTTNLGNLNGFPLRFRVITSNGNNFVKGRIVTRLYSRY